MTAGFVRKVADPAHIFGKERIDFLKRSLKQWNGFAGSAARFQRQHPNVVFRAWIARHVEQNRPSRDQLVTVFPSGDVSSGCSSKAPLEGFTYRPRRPGRWEENAILLPSGATTPDSRRQPDQM